MTQLQKTLAEYTLPTDVVIKAGVRFTDKADYTVFAVERSGVVYKLEIAVINASHLEVKQKFHQRTLVITDLPNLVEAEKQSKKDQKIADLKAKMQIAKSKGWCSQYKVYKKELLKLY